jgi:ABC-type transporter Mla subunit MlaD
MSTQARVGIFTLLTLIGVFATYYFITNFALRHSGYQIGVHFHDVGGLQEGSSVLLSGVQIGEVTAVQLLPDETVEVICTINPGNVIYRDSVFTVAITITGATTLTIKPPVVHQVAMVLPQKPLPIERQPWGGLPPSLTDLVSAGQDQLKQLEKTLAVVNKALPALLGKFTDVANDTDHLIAHTDRTLNGLSGQLNATVAMLNVTIESNGRNITQLTGNLNELLAGNRGRLSTLIDNLAKTSENLNKTMDGVASIAQDPALHASLVGTAKNVADATAKLKAIATEIEGITGDQKTQSDLRGIIRNLSDASAKADDLLGGFSSGGADEASPSAASPGPENTGSTPRPNVRRSGGHRRGGMLGVTLAEAQIRETWGTHGGGPNSDLNIVLLPRSDTHFTLGANDLGYAASYNFLIGKNLTRNFQVSGGVLYSKLGLAALFRPFGGPFGVDARVYDPKHPTLDLYGDLRLTQRLQLFYGDRSIWGTSAKTPSFGIQINY